MQEKYVLGEESLGEKYIGEKYVQEEFLGEEFLGATRVFWVKSPVQEESTG